MLMARDADELAFKEKRMRRIYHDAGGIDVPEIAEKGMGAEAQEHGLHGWPDWHIMGPDGWCGSVVRHTRHVRGHVQDVSADVSQRNV